MNYKIKKAFGDYKVGDSHNKEYLCEDLCILPGGATIALLEHCGFIEPITEWSADSLKEGDEYWFIDTVCKPSISSWTNHRFDLFRLKSKNIYRTREEAEEAYKRIMNS